MKKYIRKMLSVTQNNENSSEIYYNISIILIFIF